MPASSSPHSVRVPYSIEEAIDPEEALVAATSSCHMLTFLWIAAKRGFQIDSYVDNAVGEMTTSVDGKQFVSKITLDPQIEWHSAVAYAGHRVFRRLEPNLADVV